VGFPAGEFFGTLGAGLNSFVSGRFGSEDAEDYQPTEPDWEQD
jgi:hypothetical protein